MYRGVSRNPRSASVHKHTWLHNNSSKLSFLHPVLLPLFPARNLHAAAFATSCWLCNRTDTEVFPVVVKLIGGQKVFFGGLDFNFFSACGEFLTGFIQDYMKAFKNIKNSFLVFCCKHFILRDKRNKSTKHLLWISVHVIEMRLRFLI